MDQAAVNGEESSNILGVLAIIVESWWILVGLPVVFGFIAFGMVYLSPVRQHATAQVAVVTNDPALSCMAARLREGAATGVSCTTALTGLVTLDGVDTGGEVPTVSIEDKDRGPLLEVAITGSDVERVEQGALSVISALRSFEPEVLANYDRMIVLREHEIERLRNAIDIMQGSIAASGRTTMASGLRVEAAANALVLINDTLAEKQVCLLRLQAYATQAADLTAKAPVVEVSPVPRDHRPVIAAFLIGAVLAVVIVYLRYIVGLARTAPDYAEKRDRILHAIPFWRKRASRLDGK